MVHTVLLSFSMVLLLACMALFGGDDPRISASLSSLWCAIAAIALWWQRKRRIPADGVVALSAFGLVGVIAVIQGAGIVGIGEAMVLIGTVAVGAVAWALTRAGEQEAKRTRQGTLLFLSLIAIIAFFDFIADPETVFSRTKAYHEDRLTATFLSANTAATLFLSGLIISLGTVLRSVQEPPTLFAKVEAMGRHASLGLVAAVFCLACLLLTGSRAGIAIGGLSAAILVWRLTSRGGGISIGALLGFGAVFLLVALFSLSGTVERVAEVQTGTTGRDILWPVSFAAFLEAPVFGHGLGNFQQALIPQMTEENAAILVQQAAAHNLPLQWLVQTGLVGTLLGLIGLGAGLKLVLPALKSQRGVAYVIAVVAILLHGLVDYALEIPGLAFWFAWLIGMAAGMGRRQRA